jgi:predicted AAA+ superfamily ATPase
MSIMRFRRKILQAIEPQLDSREIIVITGMRRVGKTTLLQILYDKIASDNKVFLDLENILEQKVFEEIDYNNIWANLRAYGISDKEKAYIFLDEIQAMPQIVKAVKYLYDHYNVKFFLTGSSSFYLKNLFPESLAGRKILFELFPLTFEEFLLFKGVDQEFPSDFKDKERRKNFIAYQKTIKFYEEYLAFGGFPQVVLASDESQKRLYLKDIFTSYFEMDVRRLADFRQMGAFRDTLLLLMQRVGSKLEISKLASDIGISRETVYSYLAFLEASYFIFRISPFSRNVDREVSGTRKVYFCDNGIINLFGKVSDGALLENAVFANLRHWGKVHYYQRRSGAEIDFVLFEKNVAFEVKKRAHEQDYVKLLKISNSLGLDACYVISQNFSNAPGTILAQDL